MMAITPIKKGSNILHTVTNPVGYGRESIFNILFYYYYLQLVFIVF